MMQNEKKFMMQNERIYKRIQKRSLTKGSHKNTTYKKELKSNVIITKRPNDYNAYMEALNLITSRTSSHDLFTPRKGILI